MLLGCSATLHHTLHVASYMVHITRYMVHITPYMVHVTCHVMHVTLYTLYVARCIVANATLLDTWLTQTQSRYILSIGVLSEIFCQMGGKYIFSHFKL